MSVNAKVKTILPIDTRVPDFDIERVVSELAQSGRNGVKRVAVLPNPAGANCPPGMRWRRY